MEKILLAAAKLFRKKSFLGTTIEDVASRLKINKAMIFYYFDSKTNLLYEIMSKAIDERIEKAELIVSKNTSPVGKIEALVKGHVKAVTDTTSLTGVSQFELKNLPPKLIQKYIAKRDTYELIYVDILREAADLGYIRKSDPAMTARFILGELNSLATWFKPTGPLSSEEVGEQVWEFIVSAIGAR